MVKRMVIMIVVTGIMVIVDKSIKRNINWPSGLYSHCRASLPVSQKPLHCCHTFAVVSEAGGRLHIGRPYPRPSP